MKKSVLFASAVLAISSVVSAQQLPPGFPGGPGAIPPAATQPTTQPALLAEGQAGLQKFVDAVKSGNVDALKGAIDTKSDAQRTALESLAKLNSASVGLFNITETKFGKPALEEARLTVDQFPLAFPTIDVKEFYDVKIEGNTLTLIPTETAQLPPIKLAKTADGYKLDSSFLPVPEDVTAEQVAQQGKMFEVVNQVVADTGADVTAGHFRAPDEVIALLNFRMQKAVRKVQQEMMEKAMAEQMKKAAEQAAATTQPAGPVPPAPAPAPAGN